MATTAVYGGNDRLLNSAAPISEEDAQASDDQMLPTFYCRALYDYQSADGSSLSFFRGDIIEVLTQLESGWWDGLIGDERGWFPSNYVEPISEAEAEAELGPQYAMRAAESSEQPADVRQRIGPESDHEWLQEELEYERSRNGFQGIGNGAALNAAEQQDFWLPEVDQTGQVRELRSFVSGS